MGTKRFDLFSYATVDLPKLGNRSNIGILFIRLFNLLHLVGGILQEECQILLLTSEMSEFE